MSPAKNDRVIGDLVIIFMRDNQPYYYFDGYKMGQEEKKSEEHQGHYCTGKCTKLPAIDPQTVKEKECEHEWDTSRVLTSIPPKYECKKCHDYELISVVIENERKKEPKPFWLKVGDLIKDQLFEDKWGRVIDFTDYSINIEWHHKNSTLKDHITDEEILLKNCHSGTYKKIKLVSPAVWTSKFGEFWNQTEILFNSYDRAESYLKDTYDIKTVIWPAKDQFGREIWLEVEE